MPNSPNDMFAPVTRGELRAELAHSKTELREELAHFKIELRAELATKQELREESARIRTELARSKTELYSDMAQLLRSMEESILARMSSLMEPTSDHEPRIKALEAAVFAPTPPKRRRRGA